MRSAAARPARLLAPERPRVHRRLADHGFPRRRRRAEGALFDPCHSGDFAHVSHASRPGKRMNAAFFGARGKRRRKSRPTFRFAHAALLARAVIPRAVIWRLTRPCPRPKARCGVICPGRSHHGKHHKACRNVGDIYPPLLAFRAECPLRVVFCGRPIRLIGVRIVDFFGGLTTFPKMRVAKRGRDFSFVAHLIRKPVPAFGEALQSIGP